MMTPARQRDVRFVAVDLGRSGEVSAHAHTSHQLLRVERGAVAFTHGVATWVVPTGGVVWIPAGLTHRFEALEETTAWGLYVRPARTDRFAPPGPVEMSPLLHTLMATFSRPIRDPARRARLEHVTRDELADLQPRPFVVAVPEDPPARHVALALIADPADGRSLATLAADAGTSVRTLQRRFRDETGLAFRTWRRRAGLQQAMGALARGENITAVAHRCGFASASAFIAAFRAELGVTPAAWRRTVPAPFPVG
jgi:AraC-like DNA-binding protein